MAVKYKEKCRLCRKNYVTVTRRQSFAACYDCQKKDLEGDITDPEMKKMFDIPLEYYQVNSFLRNIKSSYLKYQSLTEKQIEAFKKVVNQLDEEQKKTE